MSLCELRNNLVPSVQSQELNVISVEQVFRGVTFLCVQPQHVAEVLHVATEIAQRVGSLGSFVAPNHQGITLIDVSLVRVVRVIAVIRVDNLAHLVSPFPVETHNSYLRYLFLVASLARCFAIIASSTSLVMLSKPSFVIW